MTREVHRIDLYDTAVTVWEVVSLPADRAYEAGLKLRLFDPLVRFLRARGWKVGQDPHVTRHYPSLKKCRRLARKGDLHAELALSGRTVKFEIWQELHGVTNPNGGRYEIQKLRLMPATLARRCRLEQRRIAEHLQALSGYGIVDRLPNPKLTAEELIAADYASNWHTNPALGRPAFTNGDRDRRSGDGHLLEHGQTVWFQDYAGRILRGQAFYSLNSMWFVKVGQRELTRRACFDLLTQPPADLRRKRNATRRERRLRQELATAIERLDFRRAGLIAALLQADGIGLEIKTQVERKAAAA